MLAMKANSKLVSSALLRNMVRFKTFLHRNKSLKLQKMMKEEGGIALEKGEKNSGVNDEVKGEVILIFIRKLLVQKLLPTVILIND